MLRIHAILICAICACAGAEPPTTIRLLAIGNSFSDNALRFLPKVVESAGCSIQVTHFGIGGGRLKQHWDRLVAGDADPADPAAQYNKQGTLNAALKAKPYDVVTIQQYSAMSHDPSTYRPFAAELTKRIRTDVPTAKLYVHQIWAYRIDSPFSQIPKEKTAERMHALVRETYHLIAGEIGADGIIPSGDAFALVCADPTWGFRLPQGWDPKAATAQNLPSQANSLHIGYGINDGVLSKPDYNHANVNGEYLAACTWFATLYQRSPVGLSFRPNGMAEDRARFYQEMAWKAVSALTAEAPKVMKAAK